MFTLLAPEIGYSEVMELSPQERSRVWWRGALKSAVKGIPQGLLLGVLGFALLVGAIYGLAALFPVTALGLASSFGPFVFSTEAMTIISPPLGSGIAAALPALGWSMLNPLPVIALNAVLTIAGNFISGGKIAVGDYQQQVDHAANKERIGQLEARERALEEVVGMGRTSRIAQSIIARGQRTRTSFASAEESRAVDTANNPSKIIH